MTAMGTQSNWGYAEFQAKSPGRTAHKIALVSPRIDVDVTGYSLKNVGTQLIDHPRDDGLKHRDQLWNFQQRYRGATINKYRNGSGVEVDEKKPISNTTVSSDETTEDEITKPNNTSSRNSIGDNTSLPSRFKKRLKQRNISLSALRSGELVFDSARRRSVPKDIKEDEKRQKIQRLYSSGLVVKNSIYNQIREGDDKRVDDQYSDNSKLAETFRKYGPTLEKLPDIQYPCGTRYIQQAQQIRAIQGFNSSRMITQYLDRKTMTLRRSFSSISDLGPSKIKLRLVKKRRGECSINEDIEGNDSNNEDDQELCQKDDEDECDNETSIEHAETMHGWDCDHKHPGHTDIRYNITHANTEDELEQFEIHDNRHVGGQNVNSDGKHIGGFDRNTGLYNQCRRERRLEQKYGRSSSYERQETIEHSEKVLRSEQTFHEEPRTGSRDDDDAKYSNDTDLASRSKSDMTENSVEHEDNNPKGKESWNSAKTGTKCEIMKGKVKRKKSQKKESGCNDNKNESDSDSDVSLDFPEDRYGPTTHSVDKKLSIRKPWEWKPCPYRWIDKPYVKESDKPYIERIINGGEIIDEFNYDSFARTRPLKLHNFPEGAGYKDRYGVLR